MIEYEYCPRCGSALRDINYLTLPPTHGKRCLNCGWEYSEKGKAPDTASTWATGSDQNPPKPVPLSRIPPFIRRRKTYREAIAAFGAEHQEDKMLEELGEFLDAYMKFIHNRDTKEHFLEELVDLAVTLEQLTIIYSSEDEIWKIINRKLRHLEDELGTAKQPERNCEQCKNRVNGECSVWECRFERADDGA